MSSLLRDDESRQLVRAREQMAQEFPDVPAALVDEVFAEVVARFDDAPVRTYLPVLAEREARALLRRQG